MVRDPIRPEVFSIITDYGTEEIFDMPQQVTQITGLGMPSVLNRTVSAPLQDGETFLGNSLRPRLLQLSFHMAHLWGAAETAWSEPSTRQRMLNILNPILAPYTFRMGMTNGDIYELRKVFYEAGFDTGMPNNTGDWDKQTVALRLRCSKPLWYGTERTATQTPTTTTTWVSEAYGNWYSYPEITLTGPMTNPVLYVLRWDLTLAAYAVVAQIGLVVTLSAGETATITTYPTERTCVDADGNSIALSDDTTFSTFILTPHPIRALHSLQTDASWYNNFLRVSADSFGVGAQVDVVYNDLWTGV